MSLSRRRIDERIARKEEEIKELEMKLREARAYVQALQDVAKLMPRESLEGTSSEGDAVLRAGSSVAEARDAIKAAGRPLHILDILKVLGKEPTRNNRAAVSGSLAAYVRRGEIFTRPRPNTFGLRDMEGAAPQPQREPKRAPTAPPTPPAGFGKTADEEEDVPF